MTSVERSAMGSEELYGGNLSCNKWKRKLDRFFKISIAIISSAYSTDVQG